MQSVVIKGQSTTKGIIPITCDDDGNLIIQLEGATVNIGDVDVASIAAGDTNIGNVDLASAIPAGNNLIGKMGIDQVTSNANEVVVKSITAGPLPDTSGSDLAGAHGGIDAVSGAMGTTTDAAASASSDEDTTARSAISILKGVKNVLLDLSGCIIAGVSKTCGYNLSLQTCTIAGPATASGAYSAGDRIGPATGTTPATITGMALANGRGGTITGIHLWVNKKSVTPVIRIHFYNASDPTLAADNAQRQEKIADKAKYVGYYDLSALSTAADTANSDCSRAFDADIRLPYVCAAGSTSLYVALELIGGSLTLDNASEFTLGVKTVMN